MGRWGEKRRGAILSLTGEGGERKGKEGREKKEASRKKKTGRAADQGENLSKKKKGENTGRKKKKKRGEKEDAVQGSPKGFRQTHTPPGKKRISLIGGKDSRPEKRTARKEKKRLLPSIGGS